MAREKTEERTKEATFLAYQTARFYLLGRSKKGLAPLKKYMAELTTTDRPQTASQMKSVLSVLSAQYGIPLRKKRGRRG